MPGFVRRHRSSLLIGLALVAAVAIAIVLGTGTQTSTPMDPDNPGPYGARALARVLGDEGVDVQVARGADELEAIDVDGGTSVVVVLPEYLGTSTIERLREHTGEAHTVIVVGAGPGVADALGELGGGASIPLGEGRESGCDDPRFDGLTLEVDFTTLYPTATASTARPARSSPSRPTGCCSSAPTRRSPTTRSCGPTTPRWRCGCSARTSGWSGTCPASTTSSATTA